MYGNDSIKISNPSKLIKLAKNFSLTALYSFAKKQVKNIIV